jgi:Yip1-like protein
MNIVDRVKRLLLSPDPEWSVIAGEPATLGGLITGYVLPLAALSAIGSLLGSLFLGLGLMFALRVAIVGLVMAVIAVVILSVIIDALAPTFGAAKSSTNAAKVAAYAPTPAWVGGIFQIIPALGSLIAFIGALYALYLLYLGLMRVMKSSSDKAVGYTVVVVLIAIVVGFVASYITTTFIGIGPMMRISY